MENSSLEKIICDLYFIEDSNLRAAQPLWCIRGKILESLGSATHPWLCTYATYCAALPRDDVWIGGGKYIVHKGTKDCHKALIKPRVKRQRQRERLSYSGGWGRCYCSRDEALSTDGSL